MKTAISCAVQFVFWAVLLATAKAGILTTSVTCTISNNFPPAHIQSQTDSTSCGLQDPSAPTALSSSGSVSGGAFFLNMQGFEQAGGPYSVGDFSWSNGASLFESANYSATIITDGPIRDGFVRVSPSLSVISSPFNQAGVGVTLGSYFALRNRNGCLTADCNLSVLIPVTLGVSLSVGLSGEVSAPIGGLDGSYAVNMSANLGFTFFELDQQTEVGWTDITSAPEPDTASLSLVPLAVFVLAARRCAQIHDMPALRLSNFS
jgi:hypothetical protein